MTSERYDLVFSGELARGAELTQAKRNLGNLFKISAEKVEALFSGKPVVLKKDLDFATGTKYRVAIKKAGCVVVLQEKTVPAVAKEKAVFAVPDDAPPPKPDRSGAASQQAENSPPLPEVEEHEPTEAVAMASSQEQILNENPARSMAEPQREPVSEQATSLDLAPVGSDVLNDDEKAHVSPVEVDLSGLSVEPEGGDLLHENEKTHFEARDIQVDASLAPVGTELIEDSEKEPVEAVQVHIPDVSLAEVGALLEQEKDERPKVNPDISHLSLE